MSKARPPAAPLIKLLAALGAISSLILVVFFELFG